MCILVLAEGNIICSQTVRGEEQIQMSKGPMKSCTALYMKHVPSTSKIPFLAFKRDVDTKEYCTP